MRDFAKRVGNKLTLILHRGQARAWRSVARFLLVLAGSQGGKTVFGPYWLWREIQKHSIGANIAEGEYHDYLAASANYDLLRLKMLPALRALFEGKLGWKYQASDRMLVDPTGTIRIILRSAESEGGLESATIVAAWLDEWGLASVSIECWEAIQRRTAIPSGSEWAATQSACGQSAGRVLFTTTPYVQNWLKICVHDRAKGGDPDYELVQFANIDNPSYPQAEYDRLKRTLPHWKFRMMCHGEFTKPAGVIYEGYDDEYARFDESGDWISGGNLVRPFTIPKHWLRDVGADFGPVNCARLWIAEDPATHYYYVYRDPLGGQSSYPEYAREVLGYKEPMRYGLGGSASEDEIRLQWAEAGFAITEPFISEVEAGIDHGNAIFKQNRCFVFDTCTGFRSELGTYSRELDAAGAPTEKIAAKQKFHRLDAWRYLASAYPMDAPPRSKPKEKPGPRVIGSIRNIRKRPRETEEY